MKVIQEMKNGDATSMGIRPLWVSLIYRVVRVKFRPAGIIYIEGGLQ